MKKSSSYYIGRISVVLFALTIFTPLYVLITTALKSNKELYTNPTGLPAAAQWENFSIAIEQGNILEYAKNSVLVTIISVLLIIVLQTCCAYGLYRLRRTALGKGLYNLCIAGLMIPAVGYASTILLYRQVGLYDSLAGLCVASVASSLPFAILILVGHLNEVPQELIEAATVDGCGSFRLLLRILVPVIAPAITSVGVLNMINVWNNMLTPLLLLSSENKYTIPLGLMRFKGNYSVAYNYLFAGIMIAAVPMLVIYFVCQKKFVESMTGSIKG